jgi:hypothetical protein
MAKKKNFMMSMVSDCRSGDVSIKRVIGFTGFFALLIIMFINALYSKSIAPSKELIDAVQYIVIAALFGTSVDKFAKHINPTSDNTPTDPEV